jgi:hypothetical protein
MEKPKLKSFRVLFSDLHSSGKAAFAFFICVWVVALVYRVQLTIGLFGNPVRPFDFQPATHPVWFTLLYFPYDMAFVLASFLLAWLLSQLPFLLKESKILIALRVLGLVLLHIALLALILIHGLHGRLLFDAQTGLDLYAIGEGFSNVSFVEVLKVIGIKECLFLLLPFGLFWLIVLSSLSLRIWLGRISIGFMIVLLGISLFTVNDTNRTVHAEIRLNPALFLLSDAGDRVLHKGFVEGRPGRVDKQSVGALAVPPYFPQEKRRPSHEVKKDPSWNFVIFVMESVGTRYIFDTSHGNQMPMPFLYQLSKESWYLKKHLTTSNVSTKAVFSLFSGLYDLFGRQNFGTRPSRMVPSLFNFLDGDYDSFLVTPSSLGWYFPTAFVKSSGIREIYSYENLNFRIKEELNSLGRYIAREEVQTVDFFIQRIEKAKEPFAGVYISFAAHFPYFDYGEAYRIRETDGRLMSRYYNNLNLLDQMIKRIYNRLEEKGLLARTIFVIVGDHGQAFGQHHPNNYMHHRYSYSENLETPALIYQPALFKPKAFKSPTSHVDILPTLLEAMRIPYDRLLFDGESLFRDSLGRKYLFFYGYEGSISSLSAGHIKVQHSLKENRCRAFDLKADPDEMKPIECSSYPLQLEDLQKFVRDHDSRLLQHNAWIGEHQTGTISQASAANGFRPSQD